MILNLIKLLFLKLFNYLNIISDNYFQDSIIEFIKSQGIAFIKFAQIVGSRNDLKPPLPKNFLEKIRNLQDKCFNKVNNKINLPEISYINDKPIAAGSIASVYLINHQNTLSIIKKVNDGIEDKLDKSRFNLKLTFYLLKFFSKYDLTNVIDLKDYFNYLKLQTKMNIEAKNQLDFYKIFQFYPMIIVPKIKSSNDNYLIMEYCQGLKINDFVKIYPDYEYEAVSLMYGSVIHMIKNNLLHGDFHYGNFLFRLENRSVKIIILDYGIVCHLTDNQKQYILNSLSPKKSEQFRNENGIKFIKSLSVDINDLVIEGEGFKSILSQVMKKNVKIESKFYSCLTTLQTVLTNTQYLKDNDVDFNDFLAGYLMENDFI